MNTVIRSRIIKIGNSQGVRIPKVFLGHLGLGEEVELAVERDHISIRPVRQPRTGWDEEFRRMAQRQDDRILEDGVVSLTKWDAEEWEWK